MSTHKVEVVRLESIEVHPNAERLEVTKVWGYSCVIGKGQFAPGCLAAYVEPDNLLDVTVPEFSFLVPKAKPERYDGKVRIKVARLRGVLSQGLVIQARPHWKLGDDVAEELKVVHYEPPAPLTTGGDNEPAPPGYRPYYDVEGFYRYPGIFVHGEPVVATEKIHGTNASFVVVDGALHCKSHSSWKKQDPKSAWWQAVAACPWIEKFCREHPEITVYGEVYGRIQELKYGLKDSLSVAVFDLWRGNEWVPHQEAREIGKGLSWVPIVYEGPWDEIRIKAMADGLSLVPTATGQIREGIVVKPIVERTHPEIGRVQLKIVSNDYLEKA